MPMISESAMLGELAAEFPGYEFSTQRTWEGVSLIAVRQDGSDRPGLCVVITPTSTRCAAPCSRAWDSNAGSAQPELIMNLYGVNAAFMSLYLHECGIHTKRSWYGWCQSGRDEGRSVMVGRRATG